MRKLLFLFTGLACMCALVAMGEIRYRYWIDEDFSHATTGTMAGDATTIDIDVSHLSGSLHALHIQVAETDTMPSAVVTRYFIRNLINNEMASIRYWLDEHNDEALTVRGDATDLVIDLTGVPDGLHTLYAQMQCEVLTPTVSRSFIKCTRLKAGDYLTIDTYLDEKPLRSERVQISGEVFDYSVPVDSLPIGLHTLHMQAMMENGARTPVHSRMFFRAPSDADYANARCFYSFDDASTGYYATDTYADGIFEFTADVTDEALSYGMHTIHCYVVMADGTVTDEQTAEFEKVEVTRSATPQIRYDGRFITIANDGSGSLHYTTDGSTPDAQSPLYLGRFDTEGIITVKAITISADEYISDSEVTAYHTPAYFDGTTATVDVADSLSVAFGWTDIATIRSLNIRGNVSGADLAILRQMYTLHTLDLSEAMIRELPDNALAHTYMTAVTMPKAMESAGRGVFTDCRNLAALTWTAPAEISASTIDDIGNPNLLLYVAEAAQAPNNAINVVAGDYASTITLTDAATGNFYCPREFRAGEITYKHHYGMTTAMGGGTAGWETIALPFDVQSAQHESAGAIKPFGAMPDKDYSEAKPYWLMRLGATGFVQAAAIEANRPYVISMPNNEEYIDSYILSGEVTFSSRDAIVPVSVAVADTIADYVFMPTTALVVADDNVAPINREAVDSYAPGEAFIPGLRDVQPFEAFFSHLYGGMHAPIRVAQLTDAASLPADMLGDPQWRVYTSNGTLYIVTSVSQAVTVYDVNGRAVVHTTLTPGTNAITDLPRGIYLVKGSKVMLQ